MCVFYKIKVYEQEEEEGERLVVIVGYHERDTACITERSTVRDD